MLKPLARVGRPNHVSLVNLRVKDIAGQIENEWRRRQGDRALRAYLDGLREDIPVLTRQ